MPLTREKNFDERPHRYELIDKDGDVCGQFATATAAAGEAQRLWPGQPYDEDGVGFGWCVRVARDPNLS